MPRYIDVAKQLVRLYRLNLDCENVIKEFLITAELEEAVEQKKGKWIKIRTHDGGVWKSIACSNCKYEPWFSSAEPLYNFCPNCGAKMESEEEND